MSAEYIENKMLTFPLLGISMQAAVLSVSKDSRLFVLDKGH